MSEVNAVQVDDPGERPDTAALLMGFGGPNCIDDVAPFMRNLMGTEPPQQLVERVQRRYLAIGGCSPLPRIADSLATSVEAHIAGMGHRIPVAVGMRYWTPGIPEVLTGMYNYGIRRVIAVSLSPLEAKVASGAYREAIEETLVHLPGMEVIEAPHIVELPAFGALLTAGAAESLMELKDHRPTLTLFTAHSLPASDLVDNDPYVKSLVRIVEAVAASLQMLPGASIADDTRLPGVSGHGNLDGEFPWMIAYQSKGNRPGDWLGPDIDAVIEAAATEYRSVAACPVGFATDHMETLYDLDIVAAGKALDSGMEFSRAPVPNDHKLMIEALAEQIVEISRAERGGETGQGAHTVVES